MASFSNFKSSIVQSSQTAAGVSTGGVTVYADTDSLPYVGNSDGDQAFVASNNRLYIWQGSGWYNVALINRAPTIASVQDSDGNTTPFILSIEGETTTITITAADSDGDPITYSATADSDFNGLATLSQDGNEFTITPFSQDSATTESGTITFKATDSINIASSGVQSFILSFESALWADTVLSIGTSSTDGLDNSTFVDRSTNAHTVTPSGSPVQTAFHPYHPYWSCFFDGDGSSWLSYVSDDFYLYAYDFTFETYFYLDDNSRDMTFFQIGSEDPNYAGTYSSINVGYYVSEGRLRASTPSQSGLGSNSMTGSTDIEANTWYHLALVRNGGTFTIYLNGQVDVSADWGTSSFTSGGTGGARNHIHVAHIYGNSSGRSNELFGKLANYRFLNQNALYTSAFTPPTEPYDDQVSADLLLYINRSISDQSSNEFSPSSSSYTHKMVPLSPFDTIAEYAVGENKGSVFLDGADDALDIASTSDFNFGTGDFTIQGWVYTDGSDYFSLIQNGQVNLGSADADRYFFGVDTGGGLSAARHAGGGSLTAPSGTVNINEWNHIVLTRQSGTLRMYVNGVEVNSSTVWSSYSIGGTYTHAIGFRTTPNWAGGYISDIRIDNTCLYPDGTTFSVPTAPIGSTNALFYLPMDNAGIFDKTGNHTLSPVGNASTSTTQTKFADTAMYFDGSGDYIVTKNYESLILGTLDFTIETWVYASALPSAGNYTVFIDNRAQSSAGDTNRITIAFKGDTIVFYSKAADRITSGTISTGQWYHLVLCRSGSTTKMFINGTQAGSDYTDTTDYNNTADRPVIGGDGDGVLSAFNGYLENFQILKGVAKYTSSFTVPSREQGRTYQAED